ncbi:hypothetical protein [Magnetovibrio sp.]|uniref:hypothetical protein n=1 Tax=Magnetovibrio sp. TaxID=2024836 RepID=UPI002F92E0D9
MLKRFLIVALVMTVGTISQEARATDTLALSSDNVTRIWRNINNVILVLSAKIALDDEWIDELRNRQPAPTGDVGDEMAAFYEKLNVLLASSDLPPVATPQDGPPQDTSTLYMRSGVMLDNLIYYLIESDSLASVAIYYGGDDLHGTSNADVVAEVNLANQRLDAYIAESGL